MGQHMRPTEMVKTKSFRLARRSFVVALVAGLAGVWAHMASSQDAGAPVAGKTGKPAKLATSSENAPAGNAVLSNDKDEVIKAVAYQAHAQCYEENPFPSAKTCGVCHPKHFLEWSV